MKKQTGLAVLVVLAAAAALWLASCGGAPTKSVSLVRTYTLVDQDGNKSGTVVLNPMGGGELRDVDGAVVGVISAPAGAAPAPAAAPAPEKKE